jgi:hypothetical protein
MTDLREMILGTNDLPSEVVEVPEWDAKVRVRGMTAREKDAFVAQITNLSTGEMSWQNATALLIVRTVVDDDGQRVFSDADADALGEKSAAATQRLFNVAQRLSAFSEEDLDQIAQDFGPARNGASSSS